MEDGSQHKPRTMLGSNPNGRSVVQFVSHTPVTYGMGEDNFRQHLLIALHAK